MGKRRTIFHDGAEYLSSGAAASVLGVSVRTVSRMRERGRISSIELPTRGLVGQHWYRSSDVEALLHGEETGGEPVRGRSFSQFARPGRRSVRVLADEEEDEEGWTSPDGRVVAEPRRPVPVQRCPHCRVAELVFDVDGVARCPQHGVVDLTKPEPVEGACVRCGGDVVWEMDAEVPGGFAPVCERCGATTVHERKAKQREDRWATFA